MLTVVINNELFELSGNLMATPIEKPLTLTYAGDEPYYEGVIGIPKTLIVHIHAWSSNKEECLSIPEYNSIPDRVLVCPNFGGLNNQPEGAGHPAQMERIKRVIDQTKAKWSSIERTILVGYSGGMYVGMLFMGKHQELVDGFSFWVGINDLEQWWNENANHRGEIEACLGGTPSGLHQQYYDRSPVSVLGSVIDKRGYINSGNSDVEVYPHHQVDAFNLLKDKNNVIFNSFNGGHSFFAGQAIDQVKSLIEVL